MQANPDMNPFLYSRRNFLRTAPLVPALSAHAQRPETASRALAAKILQDSRFPRVRHLGQKLLASGLKAGTTYPEIWIRDTNTFLEAALPVNDSGVFRQALLNFLAFQGPQGDIVDGYLPKGDRPDAPPRYSTRLPSFVAFKNTVETDQESSLVSAVRKYLSFTHDSTLLPEPVDGKTVLARLGEALRYVRRERWDGTRGLVWGGATIDWGDIQPEDNPGAQIVPGSHPACGIYGNAMYSIAIRDYLTMLEPGSAEHKSWTAARRELDANIRKHLWDAQRGKFRPHLYLRGSPFPPNFDEDRIYYHGGTAIAIEAGLLSDAEVRASLNTMRENVRAAGAGSIGLTVYPPYPKELFTNPHTNEPYTCQNGGDWCWFGARMVQQLIRLGMVDEAYREFDPMVNRVSKADDFWEWWSRKNEPRGSGSFRGGAGVILKAIDDFLTWAKHV